MSCFFVFLFVFHLRDDRAELEKAGTLSRAIDRPTETIHEVLLLSSNLDLLVYQRNRRKNKPDRPTENYWAKLVEAENFCNLALEGQFEIFLKYFSSASKINSLRNEGFEIFNLKVVS